MERLPVNCVSRNRIPMERKLCKTTFMISMCNSFGDKFGFSLRQAAVCYIMCIRCGKIFGVEMGEWSMYLSLTRLRANATGAKN